MDVLLVEDEALAQRAQQLILKGGGNKVTIAQTSKQAIDIAKEKVFDLILMDIGLPDVDGIETARELKARSLNTKTPIVALTGHLDKAEHKRCLAVGMLDVVVKPITSSLLDRIKQQIEQQG
jgi:CheY-like chemotaxis protein